MSREQSLLMFGMARLFPSSLFPIMSEPDPSLPSVSSLPASRISDRAALEAAFAGIAGLLLGRVLLGRGAGLLMGSAAIAARLLTDAAARKPQDDGGEPTPPVPVPVPTANDTVAAPTDAPAQSIPFQPREIDKAASAEAVPANFSTLNQTQPGIFEALETLDDHPPAETKGDFQPAHLAPLGLSDGIDEAAATPPAEVGRMAGAAGNAFANLFTETQPSPASLVPAAGIAAYPAAQEVDTESSLDPLPAFPTLTEIFRTEASNPAIAESPHHSPELSLTGFPELALLHPEDIWKMAAAETSPVVRHDSSSAPVAPGEAPVETTPATTPPGGEPLDYPVHAASVLTPQSPEPQHATAPPAAPPLSFDSSAALLPAFPAGMTFRPPTGPVPPTEMSPDTGAAPAAPEPVDHDPDPKPIPDPEAGQLPVITLTKGRNPPASVAVPPSGEPGGDPLPPSPSAERGDFNPKVVENPGETSAALPSSVPAPRRSGLVWMIVLLLAAAAAWFYRSKMNQVEHSPLAPSSIVEPRPETNPAPRPSKVPAVAPPAPATPEIVPPMAPGNPPPPSATPPEKKSATAPSPIPSETSSTPIPAGVVVYAEPPAGVPQEFPSDSLQGKARHTLEKLLAAKAIPEITSLVHDPTAAEKLAARWFPSGSLQPGPWKRIIFDSSDQAPRSSLKASLFRVVTNEIPLGFPVAVEDTRSGPRIDFNAFVQCRDRLLDFYIAQPGNTPQSFLVLLRRGHYFGEDLTPAELEQLICFEITSPNPGSPKHRVFIQRGSEMGRLAVRRFVWDKSYTPVVELTRQGKHIEITAIIRDVWRQPPA